MHRKTIASVALLLLVVGILIPIVVWGDKWKFVRVGKNVPHGWESQGRPVIKTVAIDRNQTALRIYLGNSEKGNMDDYCFSLEFFQEGEVGPRKIDTPATVQWPSLPGSLSRRFFTVQFANEVPARVDIKISPVKLEDIGDLLDPPEAEYIIHSRDQL